MIVAGVMSGTSADGINVALARIDARRSRSRGGGRESSPPRFEYLTHAEFPYSKRVRAAVLAAMNAERARVADLARLNFLLGELYADAVIETQRKSAIVAELAGCHGQTLFHQGEAANFLGRKLAVTWQCGEGAVLAARLGIPVVTDFRPADMAAGGKGAPLVPFLDYLLYRSERVGRIVQNIGGIANLTAMPAKAAPEQMIAFDTGPGNMVIDAVMERLFEKPFDRDGRIAATGQVLEGVVDGLLRAEFFRRQPPKTAGREQFGREFVNKFLTLCRRAKKHDVVATATALTARSIAQAIARLVLPRGGNFAEIVVSGGGLNNFALMAMLSREFAKLGLQIRPCDEFGLPSEAKEAAMIALLAYRTWNRLPSNVPSATGARSKAILGKISYA